MNFMAHKKIYDVLQFNRLMEDYSGGKDVNVAFGMRPSGTIHLGNLFTLTLAGHVVNTIGPHVSNLVITLLDTELPFKGDWDFTQTGYVRHYRDLPCEGYGSYAQKSMEGLSEAMEGLQEEIKIPFSVKFLSNVQRESSFRRNLKRILENEKSKEIFRLNGGKRVEVFPLCRKCGTSYVNSVKGKLNYYEDGIIHTFCSNSECDIEKYEVDVLDPYVDLSVNPLMGVLRDFVEPVIDLHIYGGDYAFLHGESREPRIKKIKNLADIAAPNFNLDFFVGPTIFAKGREKMSKSANNGVDCDHLKRLFGDSYMKYVLEFTRGIVEEGFSLVDYALVHDRLLS